MSAADIFLSYSREDQAIARRFAEALQAEGFSVWWDQALHAGEAFDRVTEQALGDARAVVVLWSPRSVESRWVRAEAAEADEGAKLVPVQIEACSVPVKFKLTQTADLAGWSGGRDDARWRQFADGLQQFVGRDAPVTTSSAPSPAASHPASRMPARKRSLVSVLAAAAVAVLAVAAGLGWYMGRDVAPSAAPVDASVAVLPFRDMSPGKDQEYFAEGVAEEILNSLAGVRGLTVTARTSSFAFKDKDVSLREVGQALGVGHILEGSVRKSGNELRVTAQLIDSRTDAHLWSRTFEGALQDVFQMQEEIARSVAQSLSVSLGVGDVGQLTGMTRNVEAFDAFLSGSRALAEQSPAAILKSVDDLKRALALDPDFALGWAKLAETYSNADSFVPRQPGKSWQELALEASEEARRLAPDAPFVLAFAISEAVSAGEWARAEQLFDDLEKSSGGSELAGSPGTNQASFLLTVGRIREAIVVLERARVRDPLEPNSSAILAEAYGDAGDLQAAFAEFDRGLGFERHVRLLGTALATAMATHDESLIRPRLDAVIAANIAGVEVHSAVRPLLGSPQQALVVLKALARNPRTPQVQAAIGAWAAYFGDAETSLALLTTPTLRDNRTEFVRFWRPIAKDVRKLPGFRDLVRELGLTGYWREYGWPDLCHPVGTDDFECE